ARNAPRVDHVNFAVHTGVVVPRSVNVVAISTFPVLIETFPQYRDYSFFVVEDEIVFVDRGHKVVDVVPVGPRARFSGASSGSSAVVAVDLSEPEIREVQQVLVQRGFLHGHVTGVWSTESREALIAFQRKEGFEASGSVDTRTVGALGLSGKVKAQSSTSTQGSSSTTTTGQSQSGTRGQSTTGQNSPAQNQSTTGQEKSDTQKPSDKQSSGPSQSTTGQGSNSNPPSGGSSLNSSSSSSTSGSSGQSSTPSPEKNKQN
ncbi:MAG: peptidoglycan-binding domain-containing protein, partial [Pseudolabrys sp.]